MALTVFDYGLDLLPTWASGGFRVLLIKDSAFAPGKETQYVTSISGSEVTAVSYSRATFTSGVRSVDTTNHRITYAASNPTFGTPASGQTVYGMVTFKSGTSDADSTLIAYHPFTTATPTDGTTFTVTLASSGLIQTRQG